MPYSVLSTGALLAMHNGGAHTIVWSPNVGIVMSLCCLFSVLIGRFAIKKRGVGPKLPVAVPALLEGFGLAEMLGTMSFGHILGAGMILGLANAGVL
jgi:photosystem I subunit X